MRYQFSEKGTFFSTRQRGDEVRGDIEARLQGLEPNEPLILDFAGVEMISFSFADEVVGRLLESSKAGGLGDRVILLANLNAETSDPIERSLERRELIAAYLDVDGSVRLMCAPQHLEQTFTAVQAHQQFRTPELATELNISVQACNNRLKPLLAAGLLRRKNTTGKSGGRQFVYSPTMS
ncbi:MAG: DUF4325 domain-containing protein [Chloroflexota bacterium]|nr:MAG: DUF4325 domain-containing protein [Chloroflexota bacterium]